MLGEARARHRQRARACRGCTGWNGRASPAALEARRGIIGMPLTYVRAAALPRPCPPGLQVPRHLPQQEPGGQEGAAGRRVPRQPQGGHQRGPQQGAGRAARRAGALERRVRGAQRQERGAGAVGGGQDGAATVSGPRGAGGGCTCRHWTDEGMREGGGMLGQGQV